MDLGLIVYANIIILFISIHFIIYDIIFNVFPIIFSTWLYNYWKPPCLEFSPKKARVVYKRCDIQGGSQET